jgi:hypothetical protein
MPSVSRIIAALPRIDQRGRCAPAKGVPRQLVKDDADRADAVAAKTFRDEVWARDGGRCRATGAVLLRTGTIDPRKLGEVDHAIPRSLDPAGVRRTSGALLLMKRLNRLRKAVCPHAPQFRLFDYSGPVNRAMPQRFVWRDIYGRITRVRVG